MKGCDRIKTITGLAEVRFEISGCCIKVSFYNETQRCGKDLVYCGNNIRLGLHEEGKAACLWENGKQVFHAYDIGQFSVTDTRKSIVIDDRRRLDDVPSRMSTLRVETTYKQS